mmetsp:Transcript_4121/g.6832  ORF Transcript_4121/g.6832 Transcript_4121/m.6832 type:complete len:117 (-) Transcript_4121:1321-1671(-)
MEKKRTCILLHSANPTKNRTTCPPQREHTLVELANERNVELPTEFLLHEAEHNHRHHHRQQRQHHRDDDPNNDNNNNSNKASQEDDDNDDDDDVLFFNTKPRNLQECFDIFAHIPK